MPVDTTIADPTADPNDWKGDVLDPWVLDVANTIATLESGTGNAVRVVTGATGTNATTDMGLINTAAAAVHAAGGGFVDLVAEDTYLVSTASAYGAALTMASYTDVTLRGNGAIVKLAAGTATGTIAILLGGTRNSIEDVRFDLSSITDASAIVPNTYTGPGHITGCRAFGGGLSFVWPTAATADLVIARNEALGQVIAVYVDNYAGIDRIWVLDNILDGNGVDGDGINFNCVEVGGSTHHGARDIQIVGNTVRNYTTSGNLGLGIALANVTRFVVAQNNVYDVELDAYHIEDNCNGGIVANNIARDIGRSGYSIQDGANEVGVPYDVQILDNQAVGCCALAGDAAYAFEGVAKPKRVTMRGNVATGNGRSGATVSAYQIYAQDTLVQGNQAWNTIGATTRGFYVVHPTDVLMGGNRAGDDQGTKTQDHGLVMLGVATRTRIYDNNFTGNGTASTSGTGIGETMYDNEV
jgi:hypothetical protein